MHIHEFIEKNWKNNTVRMMADAYGVTDDTIERHCDILGIDPISKKDLKIAFILDNRELMSQAHMADALKCSRACISMLVKQIDSGEAFRE